MEIHGCATMILVITAMSAMKIRNIGYLPKLFIIGTSKDTKVSTEFRVSSIIEMKLFALNVQMKIKEVLVIMCACCFFF